MKTIIVICMMMISTIAMALPTPGSDKPAPPDQNIYLKVERRPVEDWVKSGAVSSELLQRPSFVIRYPLSPIDGHRLYKSPVTGQVHEINKDIQIIEMGNQVISMGEANDILQHIIRSYIRDQMIARQAADAETARVKQKAEQANVDAAKKIDK